jgi:hypothetical protein
VYVGYRSRRLGGGARREIESVNRGSGGVVEEFDEFDASGGEGCF